MSELILPNGKKHISFSEMSEWMKCPHRHKLLYIDGLGKDEYSIHLVFGTAVHAACENFINTGVMDVDIALKILNEGMKEPPKQAEIARNWAKGICADVPDFFNTTFPGWKKFDAEELLMEEVFHDEEKDEKTKFGKFKGFIDAIVEAKTLNATRKKDVTWILDWKTCGWGWRADQKRDYMKRLQLSLYKTFWAKKHNVDPKSIRCGFILLKKTAKPGQHCELVQVSVGDKTMLNAEKNVKHMLRSLNKKMTIKNRNSCQYCEFKNTEFCT